MTTTFKINNLHLAILGPSGGGKGTQAELLAKQFKLVHLSMGDLLRQEVNRKTALGRKLQQAVNAGKLVPDELALKILFRALEKIIPRGFIIDGVPRTLNQAKLIDRFLDARRSSLDKVILLKVADEIILARRQKMIAQGKLFQPGRQDDQESILRQRLDFYRRNIGGIEKYYQKRGVLIITDGARPVDVINNDLAASLNKRQ